MLLAQIRKTWVHPAIGNWAKIESAKTRRRIGYSWLLLDAHEDVNVTASRHISTAGLKIQKWKASATAKIPGVLASTDCCNQIRINRS